MAEAITDPNLSENVEISKTIDTNVEASDAGSSKVVEDAPADESKVSSNEESSGSVDTADDDSKKRDACAQIEFYFADSNLPYDRFMWSLHTKNDEHWVPIKTVTSFKRMKEYSKKGDDWILDALRLSEELEIDETNTNVRRKTEVREPEGQFERSIYAKGFGKEEPGLQEELEKFFKRYGKVNAVRMRRVQETKEFKGSVFVEFSEIKEANSFLNADPKPTWKGEELLVMTKEAYCDMKIKEKGLTGKNAILRKQSNLPGGRKGFNAFREMEKEKSGKTGRTDKPKPEIWLEFMGSKIRVHEDDGGSVKEEDVPYVKGSALKISGCGGKINFDDIKKPLKEKFSRAPFVQYKSGDDFGLVGFDKALSEEEIQFVKDTIKTLDEREVTWSAADEAEEKALLLERATSAAQRAFTSSQSSNRGSSRGGRGRGRGRGGHSRGGRSNHNNTPRESKAAPSETKADAGGEKRKRPVEPDGSADTGMRGQGVPTIQSAKKIKTEEGKAVKVES